MNGHWIALESALTITDDDLTIDASPNWLNSWPSGEPGINLEGIHAPGGTIALYVDGAKRFAVKGIQIWGAHSDLIPGFSIGILLRLGANGAMIGSGSPGGRMLLNGMANDAILIDQSHDSKIVDTYIGTSPHGNLRVGNGGRGVVIIDGQRNQIGGGNGMESNLIGGSGGNAVDIMGVQAVINNSIGGSFSQPITNAMNGIRLSAGASMNGIGGVVYLVPGGIVFSSTLGNTIEWSGEDGVTIQDSITTKNGMMQSTIDGSSEYGVHLDGAGNSNAIAGNSVTRSGWHGIMLDNGAISDWVLANWVGTNSWGEPGLGNALHGIDLSGGAQKNTIEHNWVVASGWSGVAIADSSSQENWLVWNRIGTGPQGQPIGNGFHGVHIWASPGNPLTANQIANNGQPAGDGVRIDGASAIGNSAWQNSIHDNAGLGIRLLNGANHNLSAPVITVQGCPIVRGTGAPPYGIVQLFSDQDGQGAVYEGRTVADAVGQWSLATKWSGPHLTATASLTTTITAPTMPSVALPLLQFAGPEGVRTRGYAPATAGAVWDTSQFAQPMALQATACWPAYLPLIWR
jgi:hypothetical protein